MQGERNDGEGRERARQHITSRQLDSQSRSSGSEPQPKSESRPLRHPPHLRP